jgi:hypothetical protein
VQRLDPVERGCRVGQFAGAVIELALAAADAAEVETQRGEIALLEHVEKIVNDLVVHGPAELRMRMQDDSDRCAFFLRRLVAAFQATRRTGKNDLRHKRLQSPHIVHTAGWINSCSSLDA